MSTERVILLVAAALALTAPSAAMPRLARSVELPDVLNRTVCPIVMEVDEDPARIPRRIKLLKCAPDPHRWCVERHIPNHECCSHKHDRHVTECVEIHDKVLVKYPNSESPHKTKIYDVAVGCTCMISRSQDAVPMPPPI